MPGRAAIAAYNYAVSLSAWESPSSHPPSPPFAFAGASHCSNGAKNLQEIIENCTILTSGKHRMLPSPSDSLCLPFSCYLSLCLCLFLSPSPLIPCIPTFFLAAARQPPQLTRHITEATQTTNCHGSRMGQSTHTTYPVRKLEIP